MNSGRVVEHFHTRTRTGKMGNMNKYSPTPYMEMNPDAARNLGVENMEYVRLVSRRGPDLTLRQRRVTTQKKFMQLQLMILESRTNHPRRSPHAEDFERNNPLRTTKSLLKIGFHHHLWMEASNRNRSIRFQRKGRNHHRRIIGRGKLFPRDKGTYL